SGRPCTRASRRTRSRWERRAPGGGRRGSRGGRISFESLGATTRAPRLVFARRAGEPTLTRSREEEKARAAARAGCSQRDLAAGQERLHGVVGLVFELGLVEEALAGFLVLALDLRAALAVLLRTRLAQL